MSERNIKEVSKNISNVTFHIFEIIKEDSRNFYGFLNEAEREIFSDLLTVQGVGGVMALNILSNLKVDEVLQNIVNENSKNFTIISGVGDRLALRIVNELKNKLKKKITIIESEEKKEDRKFLDLVSCLQNLGYAQNICESTASIVIKDNAEKSIEDLIPISLRHLSRPSWAQYGWKKT